MITAVEQLDTHALVALFVLGAVAQAVQAWRRRERIQALVDAEPRGRARFYWRLTAVWSAAAALVWLVVVAHPDLAAADVGWAWPRRDADSFAWAFAAAWTLGLLLSVLLRWVRRGRGVPQRPRHPVVPRSGREVPLAAVALLCTSTAEEVVYRGLFIGAGTQLYHLPVALAAALSLALFTAGHANQGRGMIGVAVVGLLLTLVYLNTGSLLLAVGLHVLHNVVAVFLPPVAGSPRQSPTPPSAPGVPGPRRAVRAPVPGDADAL